MTIHGVGYRSLEYQATPMWERLMPIASMEFRSMFQNRRGLIIFIICQVPAIAYLIMMMIILGIWKLFGEQAVMSGNEGFVALSEESPQNPISPAFYVDQVMLWSFPSFLVLTFLVSCRAVAKDRAANALEIYWTRGITPIGYFLAKWFGSFLLLGVGFVALPVCQWIIGVMMAPDATFFDSTYAFMPRVILTMTLFTAVMSGMAVGFSALSRSPNFSAILWVLLMFGSTALGNALSQIFRSQLWLRSLSPWDSAGRLVHWGAGVQDTRDQPLWSACMVIGTVILLLVLALSRRLRVQEAVQ